jgi:hypothetical protein
MYNFLISQGVLILGFIILSVIFDIIFVAWLSHKHKINSLNIKKMARVWHKEFTR